MSNDEHAVAALLDRGGAGPTVDPPTAAIVAAGRQRLRRRNTVRTATTAVAVGVVAVSILAIVSGGSTRRHSSPVTAEPIAGPSAQQLAAGHWTQIPPPPIRLCDPTLVSTGPTVVALEPCASHAALYDPATNRWTRLPSPTAVHNDQWVAAWGAGELIVVSAKTGSTQTLHLGDKSWQEQDVLPSRGAESVVWTGRNFVANVVDVHSRRNESIATTFTLRGHTWTPTASLPKPRVGYVASAPLVPFDGALYSLVNTNDRHSNPADSYISGHVELLRLDAGHWQPVTIGKGAPKTQLQLTPTGAGIFAAGSACPAAVCTLEAAVGAILKPASSGVTTLAHPKRVAPYPYDTAAGRDAVVFAYPPGSADIARPTPTPGSIWIYDLTANRWLPGPTQARDGGRLGQLTWTSNGVVAIGDNADSGRSSWILRPATH